MVCRLPLALLMGALGLALFSATAKAQNLAAPEKAGERTALFQKALDAFAEKDDKTGCNLLASFVPSLENAPIHHSYLAICYLKQNNWLALKTLLQKNDSRVFLRSFAAYLLESYEQQKWEISGEDLAYLLNRLPQLQFNPYFLLAYSPKVQDAKLVDQIFYWIWLYGNPASLQKIKLQLEKTTKSSIAKGDQKSLYNYFQYRLEKNRCKEVLDQAPEAIQTLAKKQAFPIDIFTSYVSCLQKSRMYDKLLKVLADPDNRAYKAQNPKKALEFALQAHLSNKDEQKAVEMLEQEKKLLKNPVFLGGLYLILGRHYHYIRQDYPASLRYLNLARNYDLPEQEIEQLQWERLFAAYKTQSKEVHALFSWYKNHEFTQLDYASHMCYWFYGLLYQELSLKPSQLSVCYQKYKLYYYGILAGYKTNWAKIKQEFAEKGPPKFDNQPIEPKAAEFFAWIELVSRYNPSLAEDFLKENFEKNVRLSYFQAIERYFSPLGFFYLTQNFYNTYRQKLAKELTGTEDLYQIYSFAFPKQVRFAANKTGLPPSLILAIMRTESHFNNRAVSPVGALGLMQIMPRTGIEIAKSFQPGYVTPMLYDPLVNIVYGSDYLKSLVVKFQGKMVPAIASYNAGHFNVEKWTYPEAMREEEFIEQIPFGETRRYVKKVLRDYLYYELLYPER